MSPLALMFKLAVIFPATSKLPFKSVVPPIIILSFTVKLPSLRLSEPL